MAGTRTPGPGRGNKTKVGKGPGWGGPAKGAGSPRASLTLIAKDAPIVPLPADVKAEREAKKAAMADKALIVLDEAMDNKDYPALALNAALATLDRVEGKAVSTNINHDTISLTLQNKSEEELHADLAAIRSRRRIASGK